ncbi:MAG TPA: DUF1264 domain-containing protein [Candidatus Binatus sp.]|nr:DUF1264 domain-containing protein [Candidatus Binatus sp.]
MSRPLTFLCAALIASVMALGIAGTRTQPAPARADAPAANPAAGYTLHIDADKHFGTAHPNEIAHHWCKTISPTLTECQLYDSDGPGAMLVGVETIVPVAVWKTFSPSEQALWHYHKEELKKVHATLPDTPKDKQAAIIAAITETYGKIYILWNPKTAGDPPVGQPTITVLK